MQTLISVFDDRSNAHKAVDRLVKAGFAREDIHLKDGVAAATAGEEATNLEVGDRTMHTAEREVAVDSGVIDALSHFFERGHSVVIIDTRTDEQAEAAAIILHDQGAIDVDDRDMSGGMPAKPGVRAYGRPTREDSRLAERAGQVSKELKEDREERAYAAPMPLTTRDRPK